MTDTLNMLLDREAIREIRFRFALALDTRDWDLFEALFTEQVDADLSHFGVPHRLMPRSDLSAMFRHTFRRSVTENPTQQLYSNVLIALDGDSASCQSYLLGHHLIPGFAGGEEAILRAQYHDRLLRTPEGWKIRATTLKVFSLTGNPQILN